ncbi:uncharacterized protein PGRI_029100 [Penicillium griseofulvum]|uniref:Uncharacterized protein n=1 Tax=Penicillium patulum TaxID=5078 RepID=A0A135LJE7_PENPA|nr:uncharacterized protein PGRI_029100 [Penicillium griseofulvum]KXG49040.1 hypothetical protein PGRI_029100 [Penicillium griseofulvum]
MKFWKLGWGQKEPVHFTPTASERFPIEVAQAFEPIDEVIRNVDRTGSPPGTLLCSFPDPAPGTSLNQFRFQLYRENGVLPGVIGYLENGIDPDWKNTFEMWKPQWDQFCRSFEIHGNTTRTLDIPPSPVNVMWIQKPNSLGFVRLSLGDYREKKLDQDVLEALWKWMLDVPPEAIVEGTFIIMLGHEPWFPEE